jgi:hypothetical protein
MIKAQKLRSAIILNITLAIAGVSQLHAKWIDYTPDITSNSYWDSHCIGAVRIIATGRDDQGRDYIIDQLERQISGEPMEPARTIPLSQFWRASVREEQPPIGVGDRLIVYEPKKGSAPIVTVTLDGTEGSRLFNRLIQIASLRADRDNLQAYLEAVFAEDSVVSQYSLRHLLTQAVPQPPPAYLTRLRRLRDEGTRDTTIRALASRLANRMEGQPDDSDAEYSWLQAALVGSRDHDWTELRSFVDRLLEFERKRSDTVAFFSRLVTDPSNGKSVRIAVFGAFEDPRLFRFDAPDKESDRIWKACVQMLHDGELALRRAGAALLHSLSARVATPARAAYLRNASAAIREALASENDEIMRETLDFYLELISNPRL